jgi:hypothetical protein
MRRTVSIRGIRRTAGLFVLVGLAAPALGDRPTVIKAVPDNGDADVHPDLKEIRVEFDQDMDPGGYSWVGGGETYPKLRGRPRWISARVCVLPVQLEPNHEYWLSINSHTFTNFRSAKGEPAVPYPIRFTTRSGKVRDKHEKLTVEENRAAITELRRAIMEDYSHRDRLKVDWAKEFEKYTEKLEQAETPAKFAEQAGRLLAAAEDVHIWLKVGPATFPSYRRHVAPNVNLDTLAKTVPGWKVRSSCVTTGRFEDGIGYIMIHTWQPGDDDAFEPAFEALDEFADAKGLIIDVRTNSGGDEVLAGKFAGCFMDKPRIYAKNVNRAAYLPGGFTPELERLIGPTKGRPKHRGKVAVLVGPANMSSCEAFLMMMKQVPGCKLVGTKSYGSSGNPKPTALPNGVTVYLPSWKSMQPDGSPIEGVGIAPDLRVRTLERSFRESDPVLEAALKLLRE